MAHHLIDLSRIDWIKKCQNCILIRHPKEVINSYTIKNRLERIEELGYPQQYEITKFLKKSNRKFTKRFQSLEKKVSNSNRAFKQYSQNELDGIWNEVKKE